MQIETISTSDIKPCPDNPRLHPPEQVARIVESIKRFGFVQPVLISSDSVIIAGHGRHQAAVRMGLDEIPCLVADHLTDEEIKQYMVIDNKLAEGSYWDEYALQKIFDDVPDFDFSEFGFEVHVPDVEDSEDVDVSLDESVINEWEADEIVVTSQIVVTTDILMQDRVRQILIDELGDSVTFDRYIYKSAKAPEKWK
jgi:ParB-like chromosome segregation protein Spo0J